MNFKLTFRRQKPIQTKEGLVPPPSLGSSLRRGRQQQWSPFREQTSDTHVYMLGRRINPCSVFAAYFSPGIQDEFLWRVEEEGENHIQVKPYIIRLYSVISKAR